MGKETGQGGVESVNPFKLAEIVFEDALIAPEDKLTILASIGDQLGCKTYHYVERHQGGMPLQMAIDVVYRTIERFHVYQQRITAMDRENRENYERAMAQHQAEWGPKLQAAWQRVLEAENIARETDEKYRRMTN